MLKYDKREFDCENIRILSSHAICIALIHIPIVTKTVWKQKSDRWCKIKLMIMMMMMMWFWQCVIA